MRAARGWSSSWRRSPRGATERSRPSRVPIATGWAQGWYRDLAICLEAAKRHNLTMWIFDEKWWPSQEVGGIVPPKYGSKRLTATAIDVEGPKRVEAAVCGGPNFVAVVAGKMTAEGIDPHSPDRPGALCPRWQADRGCVRRASGRS